MYLSLGHENLGGYAHFHNMTQTIHINASDGTDFYQQIATFAYGSYALHGSGAVIVTEGEFRVHGEGRGEAALAYIPFSQEAELPDEVIEQINDYDPELECIFAMVDSEGKATVLTLNAQKLDSTPKRLYEESIKSQQLVPSPPGTVVPIPSDTVIRLNMILSRAGEDEDGDKDKPGILYKCPSCMQLWQEGILLPGNCRTGYKYCADCKKKGGE